MSDELLSRVDVAWVRCQVPRKAHSHVREVSSLTGIPIAHLYSLILTRELYDIRSKDYARALLRDLDGVELPYRRIRHIPGVKPHHKKEEGHYESRSRGE